MVHHRDLTKPSSAQANDGPGEHAPPRPRQTHLPRMGARRPALALYGRAMLQPLPDRVDDWRDEYFALLRRLLDLVGVEPAPPVEGDSRPSHVSWHHRARWAVGEAVARRAGDAPEEWFVPVVRAAVMEPDPSFNRQLVEPAVIAFGRRRVLLALVAYVQTGSSPDAAGAANAWYWAQVSLTYRGESTTPTPESAAEYERYRDLHERYHEAALRRFVADDNLDVRRCILPSLPLWPDAFPAELHDTVAEAIRIARASDDDYLRHRVELQVRGRD